MTVSRSFLVTPLRPDAAATHPTRGFPGGVRCSKGNAIPLLVPCPARDSLVHGLVVLPADGSPYPLCSAVLLRDSDRPQNAAHRNSAARARQASATSKRLIFLIIV